MSTKQQARINKALTQFGSDMCIQAYILNVKQGEGGTVIEIETGIPKRNQSAAIDAGKSVLANRIAAMAS